MTASNRFSMIELSDVQTVSVPPAVVLMPLTAPAAPKEHKAKMTAEEAVTFDRYSETNANILKAAARARGCSCEPYTDWFTYDRWTAQGQQVQRGEKATHLSTMIEVRKPDEGGELKVVGKRSWRVYVFCRCQVKTL